jgi:hypothetical protein
MAGKKRDLRMLREVQSWSRTRVRSGPELRLVLSRNKVFWRVPWWLSPLGVWVPADRFRRVFCPKTRPFPPTQSPIVLENAGFAASG